MVFAKMKSEAQVVGQPDGPEPDGQVMIKNKQYDQARVKYSQAIESMTVRARPWEVCDLCAGAGEQAACRATASVRGAAQ